MTLHVEGEDLYYTYSAELEENTEFKFKEVGDTDWSNQLQQWVVNAETGEGEWKNFDNFKTGTVEDIRFDFTDSTKYRYAKCGAAPQVEQTYTVTLYAPICGIEPPTVEIIGDFDSWAGTAMTPAGEVGVYSATVTALSGSKYKFREAGMEWANEVQALGQDAEGNPEWKGISDLIFPAETTVVNTFRGANYKWTLCDHAAVEIVTAEAVKATKVIKNGELIIILENGTRYNATGAQVK